MDPVTLMMIVALLLGLVMGAVRLMRFIGFVAGGAKGPAVRGRSFDEQLSFDERVAERLRELDRDRRVQ